MKDETPLPGPFLLSRSLRSSSPWLTPSLRNSSASSTPWRAPFPTETSTLYDLNPLSFFFSTCKSCGRNARLTYGPDDPWPLRFHYFSSGTGISRVPVYPFCLWTQCRSSVRHCLDKSPVNTLVLPSRVGSGGNPVSLELSLNKLIHGSECEVIYELCTVRNYYY